ncbi:sensor histidine kinase [Ammonicoccus fulvus]|uniref:Oxygen sensor histidine kinase NreB n=1 Tax=Ammonicoccus fulvus TaxID=3138240 RepID=A0ABZ3FMC8_9ACTN
MQHALRSLRVLQHAVFAALVAICASRAWAIGVHPGVLLGVTVPLVACYAAGPLLARRFGAGPSGWVPAGTVGVLWLLALTGCWIASVIVAPDHVWLAFSLWLLAGQVLSFGWAIAYAAAALAIVVLHPWSETGHLTTAGVLGPSLGAVFAVVVSRGQMALVSEVLERQKLVQSLVRAQQEADSLHTELADAQRRAGALSERARLARDIHDTLAQGFSSIVLLSRAGSEADDPVRLRDSLQRIGQTAGDNLLEARRVVAALTPSDLAGSSLVAALTRVVDRFADETGLHTELHLDGEPGGLPTTIEVALLRTAQGALANVRRHARASRADVSLSVLADSVRLDIVDDGIGFDPAAAPPVPDPAHGGYGLPSTRARLRELGGGLEIESAPGQGTAISAWLPLGTGSAP